MTHLLATQFSALNAQNRKVVNLSYVISQTKLLSPCARVSVKVCDRFFCVFLCLPFSTEAKMSWERDRINLSTLIKIRPSVKRWVLSALTVGRHREKANVITSLSDVICFNSSAVVAPTFCKHFRPSTRCSSKNGNLVYIIEIFRRCLALNSR